MEQEQYNKIMRERNKSRYHSDLEYKKKVLRKGNLRNKVISILIENHKEEFIKIRYELNLKSIKEKRE